MPTYEYACKSCGAHLEVVQRFTDDPLTECHVCGGELRKVFGSIGITFKGSGFYKTDSRAASSGSKARSESSGSGDSGSSSTSESSKTESSGSGASGSDSGSSSSPGGSTSKPAEAKTA